MFDTDVRESQNDFAPTSSTGARTNKVAVPEWRQVDQRLRSYARYRSELDAAEAFDLLRAKAMKLYALMGCATHWEYMERELGYGAHAGFAAAHPVTCRPIRSAPICACEI